MSVSALNMVSYHKIGFMNLFSEVSQLQMNRGYSTYEIKTAVMLVTRLHTTHWDQEL